MRKRKIPNNSPVTYGLLKTELKTELKTALKPYATKVELYRAISGLEDRMNRKFDYVHYRINSLESRIDGLEKKMDARFDKLEAHIDAFMKRTETNDQEIKLLGKQHDDLAKYCTQKIGYPVYGRNL